MISREFRIEKASVAADGATIAGLASAFGKVTAYRERIQKGAFTDTLRAHAERGSRPAMLYGHDQRLPVGKWLELKETAEGLMVKGQLTNATAASREARQLLAEGLLDGLSIGFVVAPDGASRAEDGVRVITKVDLHEISLCACPADQDARVREVRQFADQREAEEAMRDAGFSRQAARTVLARGWKGLNNDSEAHDPVEIERHVRSLFDHTNRLKEMFK